MKTPNRLIGFDIRKPGAKPVGWGRLDLAAKPFRPHGPGAAPWLTFDKYINPSVFGYEGQIESTQYSVGDRIIISDGINYGFDSFLLWDDARDMMIYYPYDESAGDAAYAYAWVDLTEQGVQPLTDDDTFRVLTTRTIHPAFPSRDWPLVGYDLVCSYFISAMAGYDHSMSSPEFIQYVRPHINPFGLVSAQATPEALAALVRAADSEIKEDPFFVIGLFLLWDNSGRVAQCLDS
ncbi:hypothetical protein [Candidatus Thiosymbion oneisti]|uniref:hypothetical protein n=1 Tax=Candidatus Thiosymbion oneisti TaxID=589554 RepID=UPI001061E792|nr:hypothetical protein [Candidatus Thiosymbion oneisti]